MASIETNFIKPVKTLQDRRDEHLLLKTDILLLNKEGRQLQSCCVDLTLLMLGRVR